MPESAFVRKRPLHSRRAIGFDTAQPKRRQKGLARKPRLGGLAPETAMQLIDLLLASDGIEMNEDVWCPDIAVVLRNLVFQDEMISESVPCQIGRPRDGPGEGLADSA